MKFNKIVLNKIALLIVSVILGFSSVLLSVITFLGINIVDVYLHLRMPVGSLITITLIITFVVLMIAWYLISMRLYSGDRKILYVSFLVFIAVTIITLNYVPRIFMMCC